MEQRLALEHSKMNARIDSCLEEMEEIRNRQLEEMEDVIKPQQEETFEMLKRQLEDIELILKCHAKESEAVDRCQRREVDGINRCQQREFEAFYKRQREGSSTAQEWGELQVLVETFNTSNQQPNVASACTSGGQPASAVSSQTCPVCMELANDAALIPCGHVCCSSCADKQRHDPRSACAFCRSNIEDVLHIYNN